MKPEKILESGKRTDLIDKLAKEIPCIDCLVYAICRNRFRRRDRINDGKGVVFSVGPVDELKIKCKILYCWCEREDLYMRNTSHYAVYYFYTGRKPE